MAQFEYGVISDGSQTFLYRTKVYTKFEYGVISDGSQTPSNTNITLSGLSMV